MKVKSKILNLLRINIIKEVNNKILTDYTLSIKPKYSHAHTCMHNPTLIV